MKYILLIILACVLEIQASFSQVVWNFAIIGHNEAYLNPSWRGFAVLRKGGAVREIGKVEIKITESH